MKTAEKIINHVKDAYLWLVEKVSAHPHLTIISFVLVIYLGWRF